MGRNGRGKGRSGRGLSADLPVVKHLGREAMTIASRLGCPLDRMGCTTAGPTIILDIPGTAIRAIAGMADIRARGRTPRAVKHDVLRQINLARQRAAPSAE